MTVLTRTARDIRPGMTVVEDGAPSLVFRTSRSPNSKVILVFFAPNINNVISWVLEPFDPVPVAPLALIGSDSPSTPPSTTT